MGKWRRPLIYLFLMPLAANCRFEINTRSLAWLEGLDDDLDVPTSY